MNTSPVALILGGGTSLVGHALCEVLSGAGWHIVTTTRADVDFFQSDAAGKVAALVDRVQPKCVFNCIGYTAVDKAEDFSEEADTLNRKVPKILAGVLRETPSQLVHYSTDFVFDGKKRAPYVTEDEPNPQSVYGKTKLAGEQELLQAGLTGCSVIRTAWLFGPGKGNFVHTILSKAKTLAELRVVHDQIGSPTCTLDLATHTLQLVDLKAEGLFHVVNSGVASWCELANEAVSLAAPDCQVLPVPSSTYPQKAVRPEYSVLSCKRFITLTGITPRPWPQALREYIFREFSEG